VETNQILETIRMIEEENLDIRTITMGISLLDCIDSDSDRACERIYQKITTKAKDLVKVGEAIEAEYGIPIINKRISVSGDRGPGTVPVRGGVAGVEESPDSSEHGGC
jgi:uncharacterized protein (UPF0210 family)